MALKQYATIALVGKTNVGKSTIFNQLVGKHISAVTHKHNTTADVIYGLAMQESCQLTMLDTPGLEKNLSTPLGLRRLSSVLQTIDICAFVSTATSYTSVDKRIYDFLYDQNTLIVSIITKIDRLKKYSALFDIIKERFSNESEVIPYNANSTKSKKTIFNALRPYCQAVEEFPYQQDHKFDQTNTLTQNMIREQLLTYLHMEIPYDIKCIIDSHIETPHSITIHIRLAVPRSSMVPIVIGKKGSKLKKIGTKLRHALGKIFEKKVSVFLSVVHAKKRS